MITSNLVELKTATVALLAECGHALPKSVEKVIMDAGAEAAKVDQWAHEATARTSRLAECVRSAVLAGRDPAEDQAVRRALAEDALAANVVRVSRDTQQAITAVLTDHMDTILEVTSAAFASVAAEPLREHGAELEAAGIDLADVVPQAVLAGGVRLAESWLAFEKAEAIGHRLLTLRDQICLAAGYVGRSDAVFRFAAPTTHTLAQVRDKTRMHGSTFRTALAIGMELGLANPNDAAARQANAAENASKEQAEAMEMARLARIGLHPAQRQAVGA